MADDAERVRDPITNNTNAAAPSLQATEANPDVDAPDDASSEVAQTETLTKKRTTDAQTLQFLAEIHKGISAREAASKTGINLRTAYGVLSRYDVDLEALQAATRVIMASEALDRVEDWRMAAAVGASKRGNHLPAKDWLLHAGIIEPLQGENQAGIRVNISIGTDERPLRVPSPLVQIDED